MIIKLNEFCYDDISKEYEILFKDVRMIVYLVCVKEPFYMSSMLYL